MNTFMRNVPLLAFSQALMMSATSLIIASASLVGARLTPASEFATLPLAALYLAIMIMTIPASLLMGRIGRKAGFTLATLIGIVGGVICSLSILHGEFWWFVAGTACVGAFNAFGNYYRFAAADAVDVSNKSRAISYVMAGGVAAAFVGPNLASAARDLLAGAPFAGSYASLIVVFLISFFMARSLKLPALVDEENGIDEPGTVRNLGVIVRQPKFIVALMGGMIGYGVMLLVMTATPLSMMACGQPFNETAFVIEWHVFAMFAPSFVTGNLIRRYGVLQIMFIGALLNIGCVLINLNGHTLWHFWSALVLLGIGWNFMFVSATSLLTETYRPGERAKVQAANDFCVFTLVSVASLSSGALQHALGWRAVNIAVLPLLLVVIASIVWLAWRSRLRTEGGLVRVD